MRWQVHLIESLDRPPLHCGQRGNAHQAAFGGDTVGIDDNNNIGGIEAQIAHAEINRIAFSASYRIVAPDGFGTLGVRQFKGRICAVVGNDDNPVARAQFSQYRLNDLCDPRGLIVGWNNNRNFFR